MKQSYLAKNNITHIDYKDVQTLMHFLNPYGRLIAARHTGVSAKEQKHIAKAVKQARYMGLIPYIMN